MPRTAATSQGSKAEGDEAGDTRLRILEATLALIGRQGIGALSNRRIAAAAGVSLGSLTYHFPSQDELLRQALAHYVDAEVARLERIAAELRARRVRPTEVAVEVQRLAAESADRPEQLAALELHVHAARDPVVQEASRRAFAAYEGLAVAALEAVGAHEPDRNAGAIVALLMGMSVRQLGTGRHDASGLAHWLRAIVRGAAADARQAGSRNSRGKSPARPREGER